MKSIGTFVSSAALCAAVLLVTSSVHGDLVAFHSFETGPSDASGNGLGGTEVAGPSLQPFSSFDGTASYNFDGTNRIVVPVNLNAMPSASVKRNAVQVSVGQVCNLSSAHKRRYPCAAHTQDVTGYKPVLRPF